MKIGGSSSDWKSRWWNWRRVSCAAGVFLEQQRVNAEEEMVERRGRSGPELHQALLDGDDRDPEDGRHLREVFHDLVRPGHSEREAEVWKCDKPTGQ
jgi:hypothetical protein